MARPKITPTGVEKTFDPDKIIVSKTDAKGIITYANKLFLNIADYSEEETVGQPHNMVRHPDMPRCIFKFLWENVTQGKELFAYVLNLTKSGDHYWVLAHVTPIFDQNNNIAGYHSSRRVPKAEVITIIKELYADLLNIEKQHVSSPKKAIDASMDALKHYLKEKGVSYDEFIHSL